jgi:hypothetical protein
METALSLLVGIGLSAACGFRVFVPLLVVSVASHAGHLKLAQGFAWLGSDVALIAFAVATVLEVGAYYIPWLDNLLDSIATPAAVIAGTIVTASMVADMSPFLRWTLGVIAGGGVAGLVQGSTVVTRATSTATTGGLGNPIIATAELGGSLITSILSVVAPVAAAVGVLCLIVYFGIRFARRRAKPAAA